MGLITDLTAVANSILGVRDDLGAVIQPVYLVVRTWSGSQPGDGTKTDVTTQVLPSPQIKDLASDFEAQRAGNYEEGDLIIRMISKQTYTTRSMVDCSSTDRKIEKFYKVSGLFYTVTHVEESYITWNVRIRKVSHAG